MERSLPEPSDASEFGLPPFIASNLSIQKDQECDRPACTVDLQRPCTERSRLLKSPQGKGLRASSCLPFMLIRAGRAYLIFLR